MAMFKEMTTRPGLQTGGRLGAEAGALSLISAGQEWSERRDSNSGPPVPQTGALTGLRYAPKAWKSLILLTLLV